jgi:hypothetical protein
METASAAEECEGASGLRAANWRQISGIPHEGKAGLSIQAVVSPESVNHASCLHFQRHDIKF